MSRLAPILILRIRTVFRLWIRVLHMASIEKRGNSYRIIVSAGLDITGKQIKRSMTWKPSPGMTERQIEKEVQRQAVLFEERCRTGAVLDGSIKFADFVDVWREKYAEPQLKASTFARYNDLLKRILPALGHIRLDRLQPQHLLEFYENLREDGLKRTVKYRMKIDLKAYLKESGSTKVSFASLSGVGISVLNSITQGGNVSYESAQKIAQAIGRPLEKVFESVGGGSLSSKTILHYHRLISAILQVAVQWQVIPSNPCSRVKAPRVERKEAEYFDDEEAVYILQKINEESPAHKAMIYVLLYTGMRRGELCGLEWSDIDFENDIIRIRNNSVYISGKGITTTTPKTESSVRLDKVPHVVMEVLQEHKHAQNIQRIAMGADWQNTQRIFTKINGAPIFPDTVSSWFKGFLKKIGIEGRSLKSLRHTNASLMIASGVDVRTVAGRLGHSQTSTTTNIYAHMIRSANEKAADAIGHLLTSKMENNAG